MEKKRENEVRQIFRIWEEIKKGRKEGWRKGRRKEVCFKKAEAGDGSGKKAK